MHTHKNTHLYMPKHIHKCIHEYTHACTRVYTHACIYAYISAYIQTNKQIDCRFGRGKVKVGTTLSKATLYMTHS